MRQRNHTPGRALFGAAAAGVLLLSGCSAPNGDSAEGGAQEFTFSFPTSNNLESPYEALATAYMEENPDVTITLNANPSDSYAQNLRTQLQSGNAADVIQVTPGRGSGQGALLLAEANFLAPLGAYAEALVPESNSSLYQIDGSTFAQPLDFTVQALVANEGAIDSVGSYPTDVDELLTACEDAAAAGKSFSVTAGSAANQTALLAVTIAASAVYADNPTWDDDRAAGEVSFSDSDGWRETLETIVDMHGSGCFQGGAEGAGFDAITNGLAQGTALTSAIPGGAATEIARAAEGQTFSIRPFPAANDGTSWVYGSSNYALAINAESEKKEAAEAFLAWVAEPEQAEMFSEISGALPVTGFAEMDLSTTQYAPVADLLAEGAFSAQPNNLWPNQEVYAALGAGVQGLLTGQNQVDDVLADMDAAWGE